MATVWQSLTSDLEGNLSQKKLHSRSDPLLLLESIGTETKNDNIRDDKTLGCPPCTQQKSKKKSRRHPNSAISVLEIPTRLWLPDFVVCRSARSSPRRETGSRREGFIRRLLKGRFSTPRPVSPPAQPGPAPCPLSPHICKSLKLSGLDHRDRAGLCQTSDSLPGLDLNGLESVREHQGEFAAPRPAAPVPFSSSEHWSAQCQRLGDCSPSH